MVLQKGDVTDKKSRCSICGKECEFGVPFSFCDNCTEIVEKYLKLRRNYEETLMLSKGIMPSVEFNTGIEDVDYSLRVMSEHIARIRFMLVFIDNCMANIQTELKNKEGETEEKKPCPMERCPLRGENGFCELPDFVPKTYDERCCQQTIIFLDALEDIENLKENPDLKKGRE